MDSYTETRNVLPLTTHTERIKRADESYVCINFLAHCATITISVIVLVFCITISKDIVEIRNNINGLPR